MRTRAVTSLTVVLAAIVGVSLVWVSASSADTYLPQDPQYNNVSYWQSQGYEYCVKYEPVATPYSVPAPAGGGTWDLMIIKAGAGDDANQLVSGPTVGGSYGHSSGKDISHIILCVVQTPTTTTTSTTSTTTTVPTTSSSTTSSSTTSSSTTTSSTTSTSQPEVSGSTTITTTTLPTTTVTTVPTTSTSQPEVSGSTTIATTTTEPSTTVPSTTVPGTTTTTPEVLGTTTIVDGSTTVPTTVPADVLGRTTIATPAPSTGGSATGGSTQALATTGAFHGDRFAEGALVLLVGLALMWLERRTMRRQR